MTIDMRAVALPLAVMHLFAQNPPPLPLPSEPPGPEIQRQWHEAQQRVTATGRLSVTLTTDRSLYFVGEDPELVITIENPTPRPLTVVQPFLYGTSSINTMRRPLGSRGEWDWQLENPDPITYQMPDPPLLVIAPGQRIRKTIRIPEDCPTERYFSAPCGARNHEGEYQYIFGYGRGASATYRMVRPAIELFAEVKLNRKLDYVHRAKKQGKDVPTGRISQIDRFAAVYIVEHLGSRHLIAWKHPGPALERARIAVNPEFAPLCPCVRLPYSGKRATKLDVSVNPEDHLFIEVTDESGAASRLHLNERREVVPK